MSEISLNCACEDCVVVRPTELLVDLDGKHVRITVATSGDSQDIYLTNDQVRIFANYLIKLVDNRKMVSPREN